MAFITSYWGLDGIIVLTTFMMIAYLYMTRKFRYWAKRGVLELSPTPFFGNFRECLLQQKNTGFLLKELYEKTQDQPYVGFYIFDRPCLLIRDRHLIKSVLVKDFNNFSDRNGMPDTSDRLGYANLFFIKSPAWKVLRQKLTPVFSSGKLKKMFTLMLECSDNLEIHLKSLHLEGKGKIVDVKDTVGKFTTDLITTTAFGLNTNSLNDPNAEFRKFGKMALNYDYVRGFQIFATFFLPTITRLTGIKLFGEKPTEFLRRAFWETITQRMESGHKRNDLIDILIELKKLHGDEDVGGFNTNDDEIRRSIRNMFQILEFDGDDLVAQAAIFFTAGFETSSNITSFSMYELALQPDIQNRMRKEIQQALKQTNGKITYELIHSLPYMDMVISETMRMYPVLPFLDREANTTCKLMDSDLIIEKGTPVYISMYGLHMDPQYFPNPEKYDPERFNEENRRNRPSCVYFPFGEGPRACIGTRLGLLQIKLGLISIFNKYETVVCDKTAIPLTLDPKATFASPKDGTVYLTMREIGTHSSVD